MISIIMQVLGTCLMYCCAITPFLDSMKKTGEIVIDCGLISDCTPDKLRKSKWKVRTKVWLANFGFVLVIGGIICGYFE